MLRGIEKKLYNIHYPSLKNNNEEFETLIKEIMKMVVVRKKCDLYCVFDIPS